jgi:outer membrane protein assembly factor BamB
MIATRRRARWAGAALGVIAAAALSSGCGGGQTRDHPLDRRWNDVEGAELAAFQRVWAPEAPPAAQDLAIGVTRSRRLVGMDLDRRAPWRAERTVESGPQIARNLVVATGGGELFALDGASGEPLWTRPAVGTLRGADDDGETTVVSLANLGGEGSVVLAVGRDGRVVRQLDVPERVGAPAVLDGYAFLPWDEHWVVVFDLTAGREVARVVSDRRLRHAQIVDGVPFFGSAELLAFDDRIVAARRGGGTVVEVARAPLLGRWPWLKRSLGPTTASSGNQGAVSAARARPRWSAGGDERPSAGVAHGRLLLTASRLALGLDAQDGSVHWAHVGRASILGGAVGGRAFVICDDRGSIRLLEPKSGAVLGRASLGAELTGCAVQGKAAPRRSPPNASASRAGHQRPLADQLATALQVAEPTLLPVQLELLTSLDAIPGDDATTHLIAIAVRGPAEELRAEAQTRLALRRTGNGAMLAALRETEPSWSCAAPEVPRAALARALTAMGERRAAPVLAAHLRCVDPQTTDAATIARGIAELDPEGQRWALSAFALRHYCDSSDSRTAAAVWEALRALIRSGHRRMANRIALERCTGPELRRQLERQLAQSQR